jgi:hypothetical protein
MVRVSPGAAEALFHGMNVIACEGLPRDRVLEVKGVRMPAGTPGGMRWSQVWLELSSSPPARSEQVGVVAVDRARLMFADADVLGQWQHDEPLDGKVDVVFWGRGAAGIARKLGASRLDLPGEPNVYGWIDLTEMEPVEAYRRVEALGMKLQLDFRPHSHNYQLLAQIRATKTSSGTVTLSMPVCGFSTSWGDGFFDVYRDFAADGSLVRLRIDMGTE